jgi:hypothetical protein
MSKLIVDPNDSPIQPAFDKYWDAPMTRREAHVLFMKLASNDSELMSMCDTAAVLLNFICEKKLGITDRKEVDDYVAMKHAQLAAEREAMQKAAAARGENPEATGTEAQ